MYCTGELTRRRGFALVPGFTSLHSDSGAFALSDCGSPRASVAPVAAGTSFPNAPGGRSASRGSGEPIAELMIVTRGQKHNSDGLPVRPAVLQVFLHIQNKV